MPSLNGKVPVQFLGAHNPENVEPVCSILNIGRSLPGRFQTPFHGPGVIVTIFATGGGAGTSTTFSTIFTSGLDGTSTRFSTTRTSGGGGGSAGAGGEGRNQYTAKPA